MTLALAMRKNHITILCLLTFAYSSIDLRKLQRWLEIWEPWVKTKKSGAPLKASMGRLNIETSTIHSKPDCIEIGCVDSLWWFYTLLTLLHLVKTVCTFLHLPKTGGERKSIKESHPESAQCFTSQSAQNQRTSNEIPRHMDCIRDGIRSLNSVVPGFCWIIFTQLLYLGRIMAHMVNKITQSF